MPDPTTPDRIRQRLQTLQPLQIEVDDDSAQHAGHEGARRGGGHYRLRLVSARFQGLSRMARHRLVYDALGPMMRDEIHALSMSLHSPEEARGDVAPTPSQGS